MRHYSTGLSDSMPASGFAFAKRWLPESTLLTSLVTHLEKTERIQRQSASHMCITCRGTRFLCGKPTCPIMERLYGFLRTRSIYADEQLSGMSPPEVFVGRFGYPKVFVGPMVPPVKSDTMILGTPELWLGKSIQEIIDMRSLLIRGKYLADINAPSRTLDRITQTAQEIGLAAHSVESEVQFTRRPIGHLVVSEYFQPMGPSAPIKTLRAENMKWLTSLEYAYYETDLKAEEAVMHSYESGAPLSSIQRALSVGALGRKKHRRFVPTRWSITGVDSTISLNLVRELKEFPLINEYQVYEATNLDNKYLALLMPTCWKFEWMEAWWPRTAWNPAKEIAVYGDHEFYSGRRTYASVGGCYYAARLAAAEKLSWMRRQAGVIAFREAYPGCILPVGVWHAREGLRAALKSKPLCFSSAVEALNYISGRLRISLRRWILSSALLGEALYQTRLTPRVG